MNDAALPYIQCRLGLKAWREYEAHTRCDFDLDGRMKHE